MPVVATLEKRRARLELKKQDLLSKVEQCTKRLEHLRAIRNVRNMLWDTSESEVEEPRLPHSEEQLKQMEHLNMKLQATLELCGVEELTVEAVVLEQRPEHVAMLADEESDGGIWREVSARGLIEHVPFQMKFLLYEKTQKVLHYRSLATSVTKPHQQAELHNTVLHSCRTPSEATYCLVSYSKLYKERRDAMLALYERYRDDVNIQTTECGGYQLTCFDVLEIEWLLVGGVTALDPFRHRFLMSCDNDGNLVENYLRILKDTYKILKDPKNNSTGRMRCLCKIIDICLHVYKNSIVQNTEFDADAIEIINRGKRKTRELENDEQDERQIREVEENDANNYQNNTNKISNVNIIENTVQEKKSETKPSSIQKKNVETVQENTEQMVKNKQKRLANSGATQNEKLKKIEKEERKYGAEHPKETEKEKENNRNNNQNNKNKITNVNRIEHREKKVQEKKIQLQKSSDTNQKNMLKKNVEKVQENIENIGKNKQKYLANGDAKHNCIEDKNNRQKENQTELDGQFLKVCRSKNNTEISEKTQIQEINAKEKTRKTIQELMTEYREKNVPENKSSEPNQRSVQKKNVEKVRENTGKFVKTNQKDFSHYDAKQNVARKLQNIEQEKREIRGAEKKDKKKEDNTKNDQKNKNTNNNVKMAQYIENKVQEKKISETNQRNIQKKNVFKVQENMDKVVKNMQKDLSHGGVARELKIIEERKIEGTDKKKVDNRKIDQNNINKISKVKTSESKDKKVQEKKSSETNQGNMQKKNVEKCKENADEILKNMQKDLADCGTNFNGTEVKNNSNKENETELQAQPLKVTKNGIKKNTEISVKTQRKAMIVKDKPREELNVVCKSTSKGKLKDNIINTEQIQKGVKSNLVKPANANQNEKLNKKQVKNKESQKCHPFGMDIPLSPIRKVTSAPNVISEPFSSNTIPEPFVTDTGTGHLSVPSKRKANTKVTLTTKIPKMIPTQMLKTSVSRRRSPRKPFAANKGKGFFVGNKWK